MSIKLVTAPTEAPVSLDEFKAHLINLLSTGNEDADLTLKLDAATRYVRNELKRPLITSTWDLCLERWPCKRYIELPSNTQSITSVTYTGSTDVIYTWDSSLYRLARAYDPLTGKDTDCYGGRLYPAYGQNWPVTEPLQVGEPIVIRLVAGWADAASVPVPIKQAILMVASCLYRNRDAAVMGRGEVSVDVAIGVQRLTSDYEDKRWGKGIEW